MKIEVNYKMLTLEETIERLKEMLGTQQPYRYNDETICNAINYLQCKENMENEINELKREY